MSELRVVLKSEYGDQLAVLTHGTNRSEILGFTYDEEKNGGPVSATFYLKEGCDVPLYTGMNVLLQKDGVDTAIFDINGTPDNRGVDGTIEVACVGLGERLKKVYITKEITSKSIKAACLDLATKAATVGIVISTDYIALPADVVLTSLSLEDVTLYDFISSLVTYANGSALVDKYAWRIDTEKRLVIYDTTLIATVAAYEGYGFQSPEAEVSHGDQINTIHLWRKTADDSTVEFVSDYVDSNSVDEYGVLEKRIELDYYASNADCALIAKGIFARYAEPSRSIRVSAVVDPVSLGAYRLFLRPKLTWSRLFSGEDKDRLDLSHSSGVSYADDATSLVGLRSTKCTLNAGAFGYMGLTLDDIIILPKRVRFFVKGTAGALINIVLVDKDGDTTQVSATMSGEWMQLAIVLDDTARTKYALSLKSNRRLHDIATVEAPSPLMATEDPDGDEYDGVFSEGPEASVFDSAEFGEYDYAITLKEPKDIGVDEAPDTFAAIEDPEEDDLEGVFSVGPNASAFDSAAPGVIGGTDRAVYLLSRAAITSLAEIRFYWLTPSTTFNLDYIDCKVKQWHTEEIAMNRATYETVNDRLIATVEFGDETRTATDEITELWSFVRSS